MILNDLKKTDSPNELVTRVIIPLIKVLLNLPLKTTQNRKKNFRNTKIKIQIS